MFLDQLFEVVASWLEFTAEFSDTYILVYLQIKKKQKNTGKCNCNIKCTST